MMQDREHDTTKGRLLASLDVALGGRIGEETMLGAENVATGASSDFDKATSIASQIVKSWGMSNAAGTRTYGEVSLLTDVVWKTLYTLNPSGSPSTACSLNLADLWY